MPRSTPDHLDGAVPMPSAEPSGRSLIHSSQHDGHESWTPRSPSSVGTTSRGGTAASSVLVSSDSEGGDDIDDDERPSCVTSVVRRLYESQVQPGDTIAERARKVAFALSPLLAAGAALQWLQIPAAMITGDDVPSSVLVTAAAIAFGIILLLLHFFLARQQRRDGSAPDTALLSDTWIIGLAVPTIVMGLAQPEVTAAWFFAYFMLVAISFRSPRMPVLLGALFVVFGALEYNTAALMSCGDLPLVTFPGYERPSAATQIIIRLTHLVGFGGVLLVVNMPRREAERLHAATLAANALVADIAIALSRYDTAAAELKLREARGAEEADAAMLEALDGIVANLRRYRPHLPNWLLPAGQATGSQLGASGRSSADEDHTYRDLASTVGPGSQPASLNPGASVNPLASTMIDAAMAMSEHSRSSDTRRALSSTGSVSSGVEYQDESDSAAADDGGLLEMLPAPVEWPQQAMRPSDEPRDGGSSRFTRRGRGREKHRVNSDNGTAIVSVVDDVASRGSGMRPRGASIASSTAPPRLPRNARISAATAPLNPFRTRIVMGGIGFRVPRAAELRALREAQGVEITGPIALSEVAAATNAFVDRVHALAAGTGAAVHSFIGDTVTVTWSAVATVELPEAKAARFLSQLKQDAGHELVTAWGALAVGDAQVQMAGLGQQQALTVSGEVAVNADRMLTFARQYRAFITDSAVRRIAMDGFHFRGVGVISATREATSDHPSTAASGTSTPSTRGGNYTSGAGNHRQDVTTAAAEQADTTVCVAAFELCGEIPQAAEEGDALLTAATEALADGDRPRALQCVRYWSSVCQRAALQPSRAVAAFVASLATEGHPDAPQ